MKSTAVQHGSAVARSRRVLVSRPTRTLLWPTSLAAALLIACASGAVPVVPTGPGGADAAGLPVPAPAADVDGLPVPLPSPGVAWVIFGTDTVRAEIASTPGARERGLMGRDSVPDGTGMLFVFPERRERLLWMKDTHVALDVAIFDELNRVVAIKQLDPLDESLTDSGVATSLLLEVRQGWFAERGIALGTVAKVVFGPGLQIT